SQAIANFKELFKKPSLVSMIKLRSMLLYFYYAPSSLIYRIVLDKMEHTNGN
ncbi:MAG: hypothetical protein ACI93N_001924, partial [Flavobacteriaceae bacterium]